MEERSLDVGRGGGETPRGTLIHQSLGEEEKDRGVAQREGVVGK